MTTFRTQSEQNSLSGKIKISLSSNIDRDFSVNNYISQLLIIFKSTKIPHAWEDNTNVPCFESPVP